MSLADYHAEIARKRVAFEPRGLTRVPALNGAMFPHQAAMVDFALRCGCAALFADTGLGKTLSALEWGRVIVETMNKPVLMLAPLACAAQHEAEAAKYAIDGKAIREAAQVAGARIYITNYDRLAKFEPADFAGVILDECFAKGTEVDTPNGKKHIEDIRIGDKVINASGIDTVSDIHRREVQYAVRVHFSGQAIVASPNHPFFTRRGWVGAQDLEPTDEIMGASEAMRLVRGNLHSSLCPSRQDAILRSVLLSEMADESAGASGEGSQAGGSREAGRSEARVVRGRKPKGQGRDRAYHGAQSHVTARGAREGLPRLESYGPQTFRAWGQWAWFDQAAGDFAGGAGRWLDGGISFVVGSTKSRISDLLQTRLSQRCAQSKYRSGWSVSLLKARGRSEARRDGDFFRVEGLEVLEQGHPDLECLRSADGSLYFYDLGGTRHPSFSVSGALVHNSSILKSFTGATTRKLIASFAATPYRLCCTATPAPNDHMELGQHSAFLGAMASNEMLSRWFIADQANMGRYRLKAPAIKSFWDWVASWARAIARPSDLGFSDEGFELPELRLERHILAADRSEATGEEKSGQARLFRIPDTSATSIHKEKRLTVAMRADEIARLVALEPGEPWVIWCDTDYEADALTARIPDALEVRGSHTLFQKELRLNAFSTGQARILVSKPSICGFGLNWQHCARMAFIGLSFSYESFYQAVRRCWRFGQKRPVHVHVACADTEEAIWTVISRKSGDHDAMKAEMTAAMARAVLKRGVLDPYDPQLPAQLPEFLQRRAANG